jgi:chromosome segregation ATPase
MLQDLSTRLSSAAEQKRLKQKLEHDLRTVETELQDRSTHLASLEAQLAKEKVDVEKLERTSLTGLFYSVLGSREEQLDKERQELLAAELRYQQTKHQVTFLEQERSHLVLQLERLSNVESTYESLLSEKEALLRQSTQPAARELVALSEQMTDLNSELKEVTEAAAAGRHVIAELEQVISSLESAEGWGLWDMFGGGLISTAIKHSRIDDARNQVNEVQTKISQFKRELADVQKNVDVQIDIGELASFADFFFDGLIFDWIVQSKIEDSLTRSKQAKDLIAGVVTELENLQKITRGKVSDLQEKRARLIERT